MKTALILVKTNLPLCQETIPELPVIFSFFNSVKNNYLNFFVIMNLSSISLPKNSFQDFDDFGKQLKYKQKNALHLISNFDYENLD